MEDSKVLSEILRVTNKLAKNKKYIRVVEYNTFFFVATDDVTEAMIFDKEGNYTGKIFSEFSRQEKQNPKEVYYEE